ncbi:MAG TPA: hypothetical protein VGB48_09585 [Allosphingosinicella sp.]|jgi:hypothetical protein
MHRASPLAIAAALLTAGCAASGSFPSLAPREVEAIYAAGDPLQSAPDAPDRAGLGARIESFAGAAAEGSGAFERALAATRPVAARAGARGSESWIAAQQAVSRVEAARAQTSRAVADLDEYALAEARKGPLSIADYERLTAAMDRLRGLAARQQDAADALRRRLSGG